MITLVQTALSRSSVFFSKLAEVGIDQGCQIFFVAYGQNPNKKWPK